MNKKAFYCPLIHFESQPLGGGNVPDLWCVSVSYLLTVSNDRLAQRFLPQKEMPSKYQRRPSKRRRDC